MKTKEVKASELKRSDCIIAKQGGERYRIVEIFSGVGGGGFPYLTLQGRGGKKQHDTSFDSYSSTYTVEIEDE